jgi:hypothetical protein
MGRLKSSVSTINFYLEKIIKEGSYFSNPCNVQLKYTYLSTFTQQLQQQTPHLFITKL